MANKVLMIGFDGAGGSSEQSAAAIYGPLFSRLFEECGYVPSCEEAVHSCLSSVPNTLAGWSSVYTGASAEQHGMSQWTDNWFDREKVSRIHTFSDNKCLPFWELLLWENPDWSFGFLNLPVAYPFPSTYSLLLTFGVAGFPDPAVLASKGAELSWCVPAGLAKASGFREGWGDVVSWQLSQNPPIKQVTKAKYPQYFAMNLSVNEAWQQRLVQLWNLFTPDFAFVVFTVLDRAYHWLQVLRSSLELSFLVEAREKLLRWVTLCVQSLVTLTRPELVIICSDHGWDLRQGHTKEALLSLACAKTASASAWGSFEEAKRFLSEAEPLEVFHAAHVAALASGLKRVALPTACQDALSCRSLSSLVKARLGSDLEREAMIDQLEALGYL